MSRTFPFFTGTQLHGELGEGPQCVLEEEERPKAGEAGGGRKRGAGGQRPDGGEGVESAAPTAPTSVSPSSRDRGQFSFEVRTPVKGVDLTWPFCHSQLDTAMRTKMEDIVRTPQLSELIFWQEGDCYSCAGHRPLLPRDCHDCHLRVKEVESRSSRGDSATARRQASDVVVAPGRAGKPRGVRALTSCGKLSVLRRFEESLKPHLAKRAQ